MKKKDRVVSFFCCIFICKKNNAVNVINVKKDLKIFCSDCPLHYLELLQHLNGVSVHAFCLELITIVEVEDR